MRGLLTVRKLQNNKVHLGDSLSVQFERELGLALILLTLPPLEVVNKLGYGKLC